MAVVFEVHPILKQDCIVVGKFPLSLLLLNNDARFPWFILVPMREGIREVFELNEADQLQLNRESTYLAGQVSKRFNAGKMNVGVLGNVVPQLHVHHIARYNNDPAWPGPVWGFGGRKPYGEEDLKIMNAKLRQALKRDFIFL